MADLIDRDAALDMELTVECGLSELEPLMRGMNLVFQHIKELPSVQRREANEYSELLSALRHCGLKGTCAGCPREKDADSFCATEICTEAANAIEELEGRLKSPVEVDNG